MKPMHHGSVGQSMPLGSGAITMVLHCRRCAREQTYEGESGAELVERAEKDGWRWLLRPHKGQLCPDCARERTPATGRICWSR
jgi:hypothetical protein